MGTSSRPKPRHLADKLFQIRQRLHLSQTEMLARLHVSDKLFRSTISAYERGVREPPLPVLLRYARTAGVCVDILIDDTEKLPLRLPAIPRHKSQAK